MTRHDLDRPKPSGLERFREGIRPASRTTRRALEAGVKLVALVLRRLWKPRRPWLTRTAEVTAIAAFVYQVAESKRWI